MLSDRDYYRCGGRSGSGGSLSFVTIIVIANVLVFIAQCLLPVEVPVSTPDGMHVMHSDRIVETFSLVSTLVREGQIYRLFTYMFVHGGFGHILFNMWGLILFGSALEERIGSLRFSILYFASGLIGAFFWLFFNWGNSVDCIGASGALFGVIIATAVFFPEMQIMLLLPPIPMKLRTFAIVYVIAEILMELSKMDGGVAHIVHLGGGFGGLLYVLLFNRRELGAFFGTSSEPLEKNLSSSGWKITSGDVPKNELDRLLDKISLEGINSLSEEELDTLRRAREEMRR